MRTERDFVLSKRRFAASGAKDGAPLGIFNVNNREESVTPDHLTYSQSHTTLHPRKLDGQRAARTTSRTTLR